jgi:hypothetical protein
VGRLLQAKKSAAQRGNHSLVRVTEPMKCGFPADFPSRKWDLILSGGAISPRGRTPTLLG